MACGSSRRSTVLSAKACCEIGRPMLEAAAALSVRLCFHSLVSSQEHALHLRRPAGRNTLAEGAPDRTLVNSRTRQRKQKSICYAFKN
jgi:hypothetical protein